MERVPEILTPDQAADYLQVNRATVYRYIRSGELVASRLGKGYRIPRRGVDLLLWSTRSQPGITLRDYTAGEIAQFLRDDQLDEEARTIAASFRPATRSNPAKRPVTRTASPP